jgi:hypothetical protein
LDVLVTLNVMNATTLTHSRSSWGSGLLAAGLSASANTLIFVIAVAAGVFSSLWMRRTPLARCSSAPSCWSPCWARWRAPACTSSCASESRQPERTFAAVAAVVLLLSFAAPFAIPGTTVAQGLVLNLMHVVVAASTVGLLLRQ